VAFHFDQNGYYAELTRGTSAGPHLGLAYGANSLINVAEIAHTLHFDNYVNLFEYKTTTTIDPLTGDIETGLIEKDLEWVMLKMRENFMLDSSPVIYTCSNNTGACFNNNEVEDQKVHLCQNSITIAQGTPGRFYGPAALLNKYYENQLIKEVYGSSYGNICGVDGAREEPEINTQLGHGPQAMAPSFLFQYAY
jgi:hypothetical protein